MVDLQTAFDNQAQRGDLALVDGALLQDESLVTAIILSLFSNRRAKADDQLPFNDGDRQGWWGDLVPPVEGDQIGSRLWLLWREKSISLNLNRAREYAQEALQWLIDDGHARQVVVEAEETRRGVLGLKVVVTLVDGQVLAQGYTVGAGG
ncbi:MAG: phage GP46 family protein [Desulfarculus sp.]|nr:phage GP46 family protein [Desulfarculus sp.]